MFYVRLTKLLISCMEIIQIICVFVIVREPKAGCLVMLHILLYEYMDLLNKYYCDNSIEI